MLWPVVAQLLDRGLTAREFCAISNYVFVAVASQRFGIKGRPTNVSRISLLTGLSRKKVSQLRKLNEHWPLANVQKSTAATRFLVGWWTDPEFCGENGKPVPVRLGADSYLFTKLWRRYGRDVLPMTLSKELRRTGAVIPVENGLYCPATHYFTPGLNRQPIQKQSTTNGSTST